MKALVLEKPGETPEFLLEDREMPTLGPDDVLIKVQACGICYHDIELWIDCRARGI